MNLYKDCFCLKPGYSPVMTRDGINATPDTWLNFYPHKSFVEILRELLQCLDGGKKTLWITGAYGTGKSHASLVLQKIFTDKQERVQQWLDLRSSQIPKPVQDGVLARRNDKILVVYDINSDGVDAKKQFLMRLQKAISTTLHVGGYKVPMKGQLEEIIDRIQEEGEHFFAKRNEMQSKLAALHPGIANIDDLVRELSCEKPDSELISDVMRVLEARHIYLELSPEQFLQWVENALAINGLSKLVYIWDEFSAFMERNRSELKTLEQLAEAAQKGLFYFVPVTHTAISSYMAEGSESAQKANDRFIFKKLDLPNDTALKLAADIFVVNPEKAKVWDDDKVALWHCVQSVAIDYIAKKADVDPQDFKGILPVHPMATFLLKHLSVVIGSNQRSMFEFLNGKEFYDFIEKGSIEKIGRQLLTVDYLWSYFIERDDLGTRQEVQEIRADYLRHEPSLQPCEKRALKAVLLFSLIEQIQGAENSLLSVSVENIERTFEGDRDMLGVKMILRDLEQKHCFSIISERCERFRDNLDTKDIEKRKGDLREKFDILILKETANELEKHLKSVNYGDRFDIRVASPRTITPSKVANRADYSANGNKILVQFILAQDEKDQLRIPEKVQEIAKQFRDHRMVFITIPEVSFCRENAKAWEEFIENSARLALADSASKNVFETQLTKTKGQWYSVIKNASKIIIYKTNEHGEPYREESTWGQLKNTWLREYPKQTFSAYTDDLSGFNISAFGEPKGLKSWALGGIDLEEAAKLGACRTVQQYWKKLGITDDGRWFDEHPKHPLTVMKDFCKKRLDNTVGPGNTCSIRKLYIDLQRPPYGLLCVPHSAFVLGFVLKPWLTGQRQLQWTDGVVSRPLDSDTLSEMIEAAVKDDGANKIKNEKLIQRLSREEKAFIEQSGLIFGNNDLFDKTVEATLAQIGERLEQVSQKVPLWVLPNYIAVQGEPYAEEIRKVISNLCVVSGVSSKGDTAIRSEKAKEIGGTLLETVGLAEAMQKYIRPIVFEEAFQLYVDKTKPALRAEVERLGGLPLSYCSAIKKRLAATSSWLWKQNNVEDVLEEVYRQVLCSRHIHELTGASGYMEFEDALTRLREAIFTENKIPVSIWGKKEPSLQRLFELLKRSTLSGDDIVQLETCIQSNSQTIRTLFFDIAQEQQLALLKEFFGNLWPIDSMESRHLYDAFASYAEHEEPAFKEYGRIEIAKFTSSLFSKQVLELWQKHTLSVSPEAWSQTHRLPAECLLALDGAKEIIDAVTKPSTVSEDVLRSVHQKLEDESIFLSLTAAQDLFIARVLPARYIKIGFSSDVLAKWLSQNLDHNPNRWLSDQRLNAVVEQFVQDQYGTVRQKALAKANNLSEQDAKKVLLEMIAQIPDAGLLLLE